MNDQNFETIWPLVQSWYNSKEDGWRWYTETKIVGFGSKTPKEIIDEHGQQGARQVKEFIKSKSLGGFE